MNSSHLGLLRPLALVGTIAGASMAGDAWAQAVVPADPPPAGSRGVVPEKMEPPPPDTPGTTPPAAPNTANEGSLSEHLSRTRGVIKPPPGVDPEIVQPPPDNGAAVMPVIPPPTPDIQPQ